MQLFGLLSLIIIFKFFIALVGLALGSFSSSGGIGGDCFCCLGVGGGKVFLRVVMAVVVVVKIMKVVVVAMVQRVALTRYYTRLTAAAGDSPDTNIVLGKYHPPSKNLPEQNLGKPAKIEAKKDIHIFF